MGQRLHGDWWGLASNHQFSSATAPVGIDVEDVSARGDENHGVNVTAPQSLAQTTAAGSEEPLAGASEWCIPADSVPPPVQASSRSRCGNEEAPPQDLDDNATQTALEEDPFSPGTTRMFAELGELQRHLGEPTSPAERRYCEATFQADEFEMQMQHAAATQIQAALRGSRVRQRLTISASQLREGACR